MKLKTSLTLGSANSLLYNISFKRLDTKKNENARTVEMKGPKVKFQREKRLLNNIYKIQGLLCSNVMTARGGAFENCPLEIIRGIISVYNRVTSNVEAF